MFHVVGIHSFWKAETPYSCSGNLVAHRVHSSFLCFSLLLIFFYLITCPLGFSVPFTAWNPIVFPGFSPSSTPLASHKMKNGQLLHRAIAAASGGKLCLQVLRPAAGWRRVPPLFSHTVKPSAGEDQLLHSPRLINTRSIPEEIKEDIEKFPTYGFSFNRQSTRLLQKLISKSILLCRQTNSCSWTNQLLSSAGLWTILWVALSKSRLEHLGCFWASSISWVFTYPLHSTPGAGWWALFLRALFVKIHSAVLFGDCLALPFIYRFQKHLLPLHVHRDS